MQHQIAETLREVGLNHYTDSIALLIVIVSIFLAALLTHLILRGMLLPLVRRQVAKSSRAWPKILINSNLFNRFVWLMQGVLFKIEIELFLSSSAQIYSAFLVITQVWMLIFALLIFFSLLDLLQQFSANSSVAQQLPLRGILQSLKLIGVLLMIIMVISLMLGKSPGVLITGLGAMTAVLMLVFKDPLLGLVAGIQLSANNMLKLGDWLEMPKHDADGVVIDINLTTVKVRNWDNTTITLPTYALISDSFKNWRSMQESGGRRIKRSVFIDTTSIGFLSASDISELQRAHLLEPYLEQKVNEVASWNAQHAVDLNAPMNGRRLTNLGTFRAWLEQWLRSNPHLRQDMMLLVRQQPSGQHGLPLEIIAFANAITLREYESIQADIFDHIFAVLPTFALRIHQAPTGNDMRLIGKAAQQL